MILEHFPYLPGVFWFCFAFFLNRITDAWRWGGPIFPQPTLPEGAVLNALSHLYVLELPEVPEEPEDRRLELQKENRISLCSIPLYAHTRPFLPLNFKKIELNCNLSLLKSILCFEMCLTFLTDYFLNTPSDRELTTSWGWIWYIRLELASH